jgi:hypothetical protein
LRDGLSDCTGLVSFILVQLGILKSPQLDWPPITFCTKRKSVEDNCSRLIATIEYSPLLLWVYVQREWHMQGNATETRWKGPRARWRGPSLNYVGPG